MKIPLCTELKRCKNLIFSQCRVKVFFVKHLSFCQYGRVRSSPTMWPKFLSPAFHNLQIYSRSFNDVLSTRFPTSKSKLRNSISINTLRYYLGNQVHVFLIQVTEHCVSVISTGFQCSLLKMPCKYKILDASINFKLIKFDFQR